MTSPTATITILVDNQAGPGLAAEHGLALRTTWPCGCKRTGGLWSALAAAMPAWSTPWPISAV